MKFPLGKNNIEKDTSLPDGALRDAINVDVDNSGNIITREGFVKLYSGNVSSLYKRYFVEGGDLKYLNDDNSAAIVYSGISSDVNYIEMNGIIYLTDGKICGVIDNGNFNSLGVKSPEGNPDLSYTVAGSLAPGLYQVTIAFRSLLTGEVSGAGLSSVIELESTGGIRLNNINQPPVDHEVVVYASRDNGQTLYEQSSIPSGITLYTISSIDIDRKECDTQHLSQMPAGQIIEYYRGALYVASGNTLWFSQPHRYGLTRKARNFFSFPERITICVAVDFGLFVVSDMVYFLSFNKADEAQLKESYHEKAVEGTSLTIKGTDLGFELSSDIAYWFGENGALVGLPDGSVRPVTKDSVAVPNGTKNKGSSLYKEVNGIRKIITTMQNGGEVSALQANDTATLTVIRNGVIVP